MRQTTSYNFSLLEEDKLWEDYSRALGNSRHDKSRLIPFIPEGAHTVAELGCGNGVLLSLIARFYPDLEIIGVDFNEALLKIANCQRQLSKVKFMKRNIMKPIFPPSSLDAVICCSVLHEVYSQKGEIGLINTLQNAVYYLRRGGRLIIRDTVKPSSKAVKLYFKNEYVTYVEILKDLDLTIVHQETYLLPFLKKKWNSDFVLEGGAFPDSTMILVAEKNSAYAGGR